MRFLCSLCNRTVVKHFSMSMREYMCIHRFQNPCSKCLVNRAKAQGKINKSKHKNMRMNSFKKAGDTQAHKNHETTETN